MNMCFQMPSGCALSALTLSLFSPSLRSPPHSDASNTIFKCHNMHVQTRPMRSACCVARFPWFQAHVWVKRSFANLQAAEAGRLGCVRDEAGSLFATQHEEQQRLHPHTSRARPSRDEETVRTRHLFPASKRSISHLSQDTSSHKGCAHW